MDQSFWIRALGCFACLVSLWSGCGGNKQTPDYNELYWELAQHQHEMRNPIVVMPGILGSTLRDKPSGRVVWGAFTGTYADPEEADGARLIALPMREKAVLSSLRDEAYADGVLEQLELNVLGLPIRLNAYVNVLRALGVGGYRDEALGLAGVVDYGDDHFTCFQFPYDWRRDIVESAKTLDAFLRAKRRYVFLERQKRGLAVPGEKEEDIRFDMLAHSMGGLVTRYYLRFGTADLPADGRLPEVTWAGAELVERAVLVATPSGGSMQALFELVNGADFSPVTPAYSAAILGTMPSVYQLLPRSRHGVVVAKENPSKAYKDILDPALWKRMGWGLANPDNDEVLQKLLPQVQGRKARRAIALDHLNKSLKRARSFAAAMDQPARPPAGLDLSLFVGDAEKTLAVASVDGKTGKLKHHRSAAGDGTVTRSSALLDERGPRMQGERLRTPIDWHQVTFLFADHIGLTKDPTFTDNVLYLLLESPRVVREADQKEVATSPDSAAPAPRLEEATPASPSPVD